MNKYICPRPSCQGRHICRISGTSNPTEYICLVCKDTYILDGDGNPELINPLVPGTEAMKKPKIPRGQEESEMQQAVIEWAAHSKHSEILQYLHHSPNGGARSNAEGARFKREGVRAGFPDLQLNIARHGYNGLFIEMKTPKGKVDKRQKDWHEFLKRNGNRVHVCRSVESAIEVLEWYLSRFV